MHQSILCDNVIYEIGNQNEKLTDVWQPIFENYYYYNK